MRSIQEELRKAAFDGDVDRVRSLLETGAEVNAASEPGTAGLLLSFHPAVVSYLLSQGADPSIQTNEFGASVLAGLCYVNCVECVRILLEHGTDPNLGRVESMETPLHHALANEPDFTLIEILINHGANVNAQTKPSVTSFNFNGETPTRGESPLHRAAAFQSPQIVTAILEAGGDRNIKDSDGLTPYHWAGWHRRPKKLVELLRS